MLTLDVLKDVAPKKTRSIITQDLVDKLNEWNEDPKLLGGLNENVLSYINVLQTGKYRISDYMNAVRFVSYKLIGHSDIDAYAITFPDRYQKLIDKGENRDSIAPYVSMFKKNELVVKVLEQTIVPSHVLNAPMHQEALNELWKIGIRAKSEMARVNALCKVLDATAAPVAAKIELDLKMDNSDSIAELRKATAALAEQQLASIKTGVAVKVIAESSIIEAEIENE